jgi:hypothetical protein
LVQGDLNPYGLWNNTAHWHTPASFVQNFDNGSAEISGVLEQAGNRWSIQIHLGGSLNISSSIDVYDAEKIGQSNVCPGFTTDDWLIYPEISGTITRLSDNEVATLEPYDHLGAQLGAFANTWNGNFGLSMWLTATTFRGLQVPVELFADVTCEEPPTV